MRKKYRILIIIITMVASFLFGWRIMPRIWPGIKQRIVYPIFPQLEPEPYIYTPESNSQFGDEIASSDSLIYYFYKDYCTYCMALKPLMSALPEQITLPDGTTSRVRLICLNKVEEEYFKIISDYYEEYQIPGEEQYVPAVVIGDQYLFLEEEISGKLLDLLVAGEGLKTPMLDGKERTG